MAKPKIRGQHSTSPVKKSPTDSTKRQLRPRRHTDKAENTFLKPLPASSAKVSDRKILKARRKSKAKNEASYITDTAASNVTEKEDTTINEGIVVSENSEEVFCDTKNVSSPRLNADQHIPLNRCLFDSPSNKILQNESIILLESSLEDIEECESPNISLKKNVLIKNQLKRNLSYEKEIKRNSKSNSAINSTGSSTDISFNISIVADRKNKASPAPERSSLAEETFDVETAAATDGTYEIVEEISQSGVLKRENSFVRETPNKSGATNNIIPVTPTTRSSKKINVTFSPEEPIAEGPTKPSDAYIETPVTVKHTLEGTPAHKRLFVNKVTSTPAADSIHKTPIKTPNVGKFIRVNTPHSKVFAKNTEKEHLEIKPQPLLNVTRSIEKSKRKRSLSAPNNGAKEEKRRTRVTFCSPAKVFSTPEHVELNRRPSVAERSILKCGRTTMSLDNINENVGTPPKRKFISQESINRLSQPRTPRVNHITGVSTASKSIKKTSAKSTEKKIFKTKMPNFAAVHANNFQQMESLVDVLARKENRAKNLAQGVFKSATKNSTPKKVFPKDETTDIAKFKAEIIKPAEPKKLKEGFNRFGFKVTGKKENMPIIKPSKGEKPVNKVEMRRQRNIEVMKRVKDVSENKTRKILQGVRLNRRFELQMRSRNVDN